MKKIGTFEKNIILVFLGTAVVNAFNFLYQLMIAHRLSPIDFAGFNALLSLFMLVSAPLANIQAAVAKYSAEFQAVGSAGQSKRMLLVLIRYGLFAGMAIFVLFYACAPAIAGALKITSLNSAQLLAAMLAFSLLLPLFSGALQGLELFGWMVGILVIAGGAKLILTFIFLTLGFNVSGALSAFLVSSIILVLLPLIPLNRFLTGIADKAAVDFKGFFYFLLPVAASSFSFTAMVNMDMPMVKYFFSGEAPGTYALAQMVGKVFFFFPAAISLVMFPRTAGLNARNMDTRSTLKQSLFYALSLCLLANAAYNLFPDFILKLMTGKAPGEAVFLGRLFALSMSFFTLTFLLISYFLSLKDLRFLGLLAAGAIIQFAAIALLHKSLIQVQLILCLNAGLMFFLHLALVYKGRRVKPA